MTMTHYVHSYWPCHLRSHLDFSWSRSNFTFLIPISLFTSGLLRQRWSLASFLAGGMLLLVAINLYSHFYKVLVTLSWMRSSTYLDIWYAPLNYVLFSLLLWASCFPSSKQIITTHSVATLHSSGSTKPPSSPCYTFAMWCTCLRQIIKAHTAEASTCLRLLFLFRSHLLSYGLYCQPCERVDITRHLLIWNLWSRHLRQYYYWLREEAPWYLYGTSKHDKSCHVCLLKHRTERKVLLRYPILEYKPALYTSSFKPRGYCGSCGA